MADPRIDRNLKNLGYALQRLEEALKEPQRNKLAVDGTIQRFEFAIELLWKTLKNFLAHEGVETLTPRESLQKAFQSGWLLDETLWLQMLKDRNETSHVYDQALAKKIYRRIKSYHPEMSRVYAFLLEKSKRNKQA